MTKNKIRIIQLIDHYDVWGNAEKGFQVNDSFYHELNDIIFDDNESIFCYLVREGFISLESQRGDIEIDDNCDCLYVNSASSGMPLFTIYFETL